MQLVLRVAPGTLVALHRPRLYALLVDFDWGAHLPGLEFYPVVPPPHLLELLSLQLLVYLLLY